VIVSESELILVEGTFDGYIQHMIANIT